MTEHEDMHGAGHAGEHHAQIVIWVNNVAVHTTERELTGAQIKTLANVPAEYELFQKIGDQTLPVGNDQLVHLHDNEHFRAIPAGTFGANDTTAQA